MRFNAFTVLCLVILMGSSMAWTDCSTDTDNFLFDKNCGFASDTGLWSKVGDSSTWVPDDGMPTFGSVEVNAEDTGLYYRVIVRSSCVLLDGNTEYGFGGQFKSVDGIALECSASVNTFLDFDCDLFVDSSSAGVVTTSGTNWDIAAGSDVTPGGIQSGYLQLQCINATDFNVRMDNGFIGEGLTFPVTLQSLSAE